MIDRDRAAYSDQKQGPITIDRVQNTVIFYQKQGSITIDRAAYSDQKIRYNDEIESKIRF